MYVKIEKFSERKFFRIYKNLFVSILSVYGICTFSISVLLLDHFLCAFKSLRIQSGNKDPPLKAAALSNFANFL